MKKPSRSRNEHGEINKGSSKKGEFCRKCKTFVPKFEQLSENEENKLRKMSVEYPVQTMLELKEITGCSLGSAKTWVHHKREAEIAEPCPFCGKTLRTPAAKQCRFCKRDWHDEDNIKWLK